MKTQEKLPIIILNEGNLDFLFDILNSAEYRVGLGENPGYDNAHMKETVKESLKDATGKNLAICYMEIDPQRKRYIPLTRWIVDSEETRNFIHENIHYSFSLSKDYYSNYNKGE